MRKLAILVRFGFIKDIGQIKIAKKLFIEIKFDDQLFGYVAFIDHI